MKMPTAQVLRYAKHTSTELTSNYRRAVGFPTGDSNCNCSGEKTATLTSIPPLRAIVEVARTAITDVLRIQGKGSKIYCIGFVSFTTHFTTQSALFYETGDSFLTTV